MKSFINSADFLKKLRRAADICHSVLRNRCAFRFRAKVAIDSNVRRRSVGKLFQKSGLETAKFLRPMVVAVQEIRGELANPGSLGKWSSRWCGARVQVCGFQTWNCYPVSPGSLGFS